MPAVRLLAVLALAIVACGPPARLDLDDPRGDTNGRMFDFISSKPDGAEWTVRLRGDSLWVGYTTAKKAKDLGARTLTAKEAKKLWKLVDRVDLYERDEGEPDEEYGSVLLRLRDPTDDGEHELIASHVSRDTDDEDVIELANYLIDLIARHHGVEPAL